MTIPEWKTPSERAPGDTVLGNTKTGGTENAKNMEILAKNQMYLAGDSGNGLYNRDRAVVFYANPAFPQSDAPTRRLTFIRRHDTLCYNAKNAVLVYGHPSKKEEQRSVALEDVENKATFKSVDLSGIPGLAQGMLYWIESTVEPGTGVDTRTINWAVEWPGAVNIPHPLHTETGAIIMAEEATSEYEE